MRIIRKQATNECLNTQMKRVKCISFDKKAQDNLPQSVKDKMKLNQEKSKEKKEQPCYSCQGNGCTTCNGYGTLLY